MLKSDMKIEKYLKVHNNVLLLQIRMPLGINKTKRPKMKKKKTKNKKVDIYIYEGGKRHL